MCKKGLRAAPVPWVVEFELAGETEGGPPQLRLLQHALSHPGDSQGDQQNTFRVRDVYLYCLRTAHPGLGTNSHDHVRTFVGAGKRVKQNIDPTSYYVQLLQVAR